MWSVQLGYVLLNCPPGVVADVFRSVCQDRAFATASNVYMDYVEWAMVNGGIAEARKAYDYVFSLDYPSRAFLMQIIALEQAQASRKKNKEEEKQRKEEEEEEEEKEERERRISDRKAMAKEAKEVSQLLLCCFSFFFLLVALLSFSHSFLLSLSLSLSLSL